MIAVLGIQLIGKLIWFAVGLVIGLLAGFILGYAVARGKDLAVIMPWPLNLFFR